jgi:hypothetical protein
MRSLNVGIRYSKKEDAIREKIKNLRDQEAACQIMSFLMTFVTILDYNPIFRELIIKINYHSILNETMVDDITLKTFLAGSDMSIFKDIDHPHKNIYVPINDIKICKDSSDKCQTQPFTPRFTNKPIYEYKSLFELYTKPEREAVISYISLNTDFLDFNGPNHNEIKINHQIGDHLIENYGNGTIKNTQDFFDYIFENVIFESL